MPPAIRQRWFVETYLEAKVHSAQSNAAPDGDDRVDAIAYEQPALETDRHIRPKSHEQDSANDTTNRGSESVQRVLKRIRTDLGDEKLTGDRADGVSGVGVNGEGYQQQSHAPTLQKIPERCQDCGPIIQHKNTVG